MRDEVHSVDGDADDGGRDGREWWDRRWQWWARSMWRAPCASMDKN